MSYQVLWDGTPNTSRYLCVTPDPPKPAPLLPRTVARANLAAAVRELLERRGPLSMRQILADADPARRNTLRRTVYLLAQRGHVTYQMREARPGLVERVYEVRR